MRSAVFVHSGCAAAAGGAGEDGGVLAGAETVPAGGQAQAGEPGGPPPHRPQPRHQPGPGPAHYRHHPKPRSRSVPASSSAAAAGERGGGSGRAPRGRPAPAPPLAAPPHAGAAPPTLPGATQRREHRDRPEAAGDHEADGVPDRGGAALPGGDQRPGEPGGDRQRHLRAGLEDALPQDRPRHRRQANAALGEPGGEQAHPDGPGRGAQEPRLPLHRAVLRHLHHQHRRFHRHGAHGHLRREAQEADPGAHPRAHPGQDDGGDREGAVVPEGEARGDPPRRETLQHPPGRAGTGQALRLRHQRPPGRLQGQDPQCRLRRLHGPRAHRPPRPHQARLRHPRRRLEPRHLPGGAGHGAVPVPELQDGFRGADEGAAGGPPPAAPRHGLLRGLPGLRQGLPHQGPQEETKVQQVTGTQLHQALRDAGGGRGHLVQGRHGQDRVPSPGRWPQPAPPALLHQVAPADTPAVAPAGTVTPAGTVAPAGTVTPTATSPAASPRVPARPGAPRRVATCHGLSWSVPARPRTSSRVPTCPRAAWSVPCPRVSQGVLVCPHVSPCVPEHPRVSPHVPGCPGLSLHVPGCPRVSWSVPVYPRTS